MRSADSHRIVFGNFGRVLSGRNGVSAEQVHVAGFLCTRLARKDFYKRRVAAHQQVQRGVDSFKVFKRIQAVGARAEFAWGLRTAKQKDAKDSEFIAMKIVELVDAVFVFGDAGIAAR